VLTTIASHIMPFVRETTNFRVTELHQPVRIERCENDCEPCTIVDKFSETVKNHSNDPALAYKNSDDSNKWNYVTFSEYKEKVDKYAKVFIKLGLKRFGTVAVLAFNSVEWFVTELATIHAG
jgi:long-chain-fatty-acid--CoA ligase ACSBG